MRSVSQSEDMDDGLDFHQPSLCLGCDKVLEEEGEGEDDESGLANGGMLPALIVLSTNTL